MSTAANSRPAIAPAVDTSAALHPEVPRSTARMYGSCEVRSAPLSRLPPDDVGKVDFSEVSLSKARTTVTATVRNPNVFALGAKRLGYALVLGETPVGTLSGTTLESIPAGGTGQLELSGEITVRSALTRILQGTGLGDARLTPTGTIETPFGPVHLER